MEQFLRTQLLIGEDGLEKLSKSRVAVFGIGGVGGFVVEALARAGVGAIDLIDNDTVSKTNLNRQIIALHSTIGKNKTELAKERILDINPECLVTVHNLFYLPETAHKIDVSDFDYVVDAVDTVTAKLHLIEKAKKKGVPIISSMGTGNKLDPTLFKVSDIFETNTDSLARVIRKELKKRGIDSLKVVYSEEKSVRADKKLLEKTMEEELGEGSSRRDVPGSISFVPSVAGLIIASEVIKDLLK